MGALRASFSWLWEFCMQTLYAGLLIASVFVSATQVAEHRASHWYLWSTLQGTAHAVSCKTRGQDGVAVLLSCRALASPTTCRFIPAHSGLPTSRHNINGVASATRPAWTRQPRPTRWRRSAKRGSPRRGSKSGCTFTNCRMFDCSL